MGLVDLLMIGRSALFASRAGLAVTGNNIANVNTPGYSRKDVVLEVSTPRPLGGGQVGSGVTVASVRRAYDSFLEAQLLAQNRNLGASRSMEDVLAQVERIVNETDRNGLASSIAGFFNALSELASDPDGTAAREAVLGKARTLVATAKSMESRMTEVVGNIGDEIEGTAAKINSLAARLARLNEKISTVEAGSTTTKALDLRDERRRVLGELAGLIDVTVREEQDGSVTVDVGGRNLVSKNRARTVEARRGADGSVDLYMEPVSTPLPVEGGRIGGLLQAREFVTQGPLRALRTLIAALTVQVNATHSAGYGLDGVTGRGFFKPLEVATRDFSPGGDISASVADPSSFVLHEYEITFDATDYFVTDLDDGSLVASGTYVPGAAISFGGLQVVITGSPGAGDRFEVSPIASAISGFDLEVDDPEKIAAASDASGLPADNTNALELVRLAAEGVDSLGGETFSSFYQSIVGDVGAVSARAVDSTRFETKLLEEIESRRQSVSGVSLDEEALNLIRFQRAFEAGARVIRITDELMQTLLSM